MTPLTPSYLILIIKTKKRNNETIHDFCKITKVYDKNHVSSM